MKKSVKITLIVVLVLAIVLGLGIYLLHPWLAHTGQIGDHVYFLYNMDSRTLVIFGRGETWDYDSDSSQFGTAPCSPFSNVKAAYYFGRMPDYYGDLPETVIFKGNITRISEDLFYAIPIRTLYLSDSVEEIHWSAFLQSAPQDVYAAGDGPQVTDRVREDSPNGLFANPDGSAIHYRPGADGWSAEAWPLNTLAEENFRYPSWLSILLFMREAAE